MQENVSPEMDVGDARVRWRGGRHGCLPGNRGQLCAEGGECSEHDV